MKNVLLLSPGDCCFSFCFESLLTQAGLRLCPVTLADLQKQKDHPNGCLLLLDVGLFAGLDAEKQERLAATCRQLYLPVLLFGTGPGLAQPATRFAWTCGLIRNSADREEWAEKIALYRDLAALEQEVADLRQQITVRWREDEDDLRSAAQIQQSLLPKSLPALPHFNVSCYFQPYEKIGGDLFNLRQVDEETLMLFLLDVSGHGISSAMVSVSVHQSLSLHTGQIVKRSIDKPPFYRLLPPVEVMAELAKEYPFERFEMFFTIVYILINIHTGQARYCCAGHPPPVLQRQNGALQRLEVGGGLIGLPGTGPFEQGEMRLERGDRLFLFSDGLIDHSDAAGECFGEERLLRSLSRRDASLEHSCQAAIDALHNFRGKLPAQDDISLLGIEFTGPEGQTRP